MTQLLVGLRKEKLSIKDTNKLSNSAPCPPCWSSSHKGMSFPGDLLWESLYSRKGDIPQEAPASGNFTYKGSRLQKSSFPSSIEAPKLLITTLAAPQAYFTHRLQGPHTPNTKKTNPATADHFLSTSPSRAATSLVQAQVSPPAIMPGRVLGPALLTRHRKELAFAVPRILFFSLLHARAKTFLVK